MNHTQLKEKVSIALETLNPDNTNATDDEKLKAHSFLRELFLLCYKPYAENYNEVKKDFLLSLVIIVSKQKEFSGIDEKIKAWLFLKETLSLIYK